MKRRFFLHVGVSLLCLVSTRVLVGCSNSQTTCPIHCWKHTHVIEDIVPEGGDGRFDDECIDAVTDRPFNPLIATVMNGTVTGRTCVEKQSDHNAIRRVIDAIINENTIVAADLAVYQDLITGSLPAGIAREAETICIDELSSDRNCDVGIEQCCSFLSAWTLCTRFVRDPISADLNNLTGGGTVPVKAIGSTKTIGSLDACDFVPDFPESTDGADPMGDSGSGAESSPFGDIGALVNCSEYECEVERELVELVTRNFDVFYAEGIELRILDHPAPAGARISGLNAGDYAKELTDALGIVNQDRIHRINGITIDSEENAAQVLLGLSEGPSVVEMTVKHESGSGWVDHDYTITIVSSSQTSSTPDSVGHESADSGSST